MHDVSPKNSFSLHPNFLQNPCRSFVLAIAHSPDTIDEAKIDRPLNYSVGCFSHVATTPELAAEDITNVGRVFTHATSDHSDNAIFRRSYDRPRKLVT